MKILMRTSEELVFRFDSGEEVLSILRDFCDEEKIKSGFFTGLGGLNDLVLSYYDYERREYLDKVYNCPNIEIVNLTGNVATLNSKAILHVHGVFADQEYRCFGGHVKKMIVSTTCELDLRLFKTGLERKFNLNLDLNLLKSHDE